MAYKPYQELLEAFNLNGDLSRIDCDEIVGSILRSLTI
jgi:hypothetical protein